VRRPDGCTPPWEVYHKTWQSSLFTLALLLFPAAAHVPPARRPGTLVRVESVSAPVVGGLVAALLFAVANNAQRHAASAVPHGHVGPVGLMLRLLRNPRWLAGSGSAVLALFVQAWALSQGGVILVQAVIASTLIFSLALESVVERRLPTITQIAGAVLVGVGISLLVIVGRPGAGGQFDSIGRAAIVWLVVAAVGGGALLTSRRRPKGRRTAVVMGAAAGVCFALDAVFLRGLTAALSPLTVIVLLINLAGFAVASVLGNLVIQRAFQMAPLRHVLPAMAAAEPVTAFLCARFIFGEHLQGGPRGTIGVAGGLLLMVAGVVLCAVATPAPARVPAPAPDLTPVLAGVTESAAAHQESGAPPAHQESQAPPAPPVVAPPQSQPRSRVVRAAGRTGRAVLEAARESTRLR
jgi:drug/metabolite transporter (DMT)-like permease